MNKVVIDAAIYLDDIVLEKFNTLADAEALADDDDQMEHRILGLFPEEWRENLASSIMVRLECVEVVGEGEEE